MNPNVPPTHYSRLGSFGQAISGVCQLATPTNLEDLTNSLEFARNSGRKVVLRGAGRSYGDASVHREELAISLENINAILAFDPETRHIKVQGGISLLKLCQFAIDHGCWPPVVSGTSRTTVAGAIANNIHGKNQFHAGTFCEHCIQYELLTEDGNLHTIDAKSKQGQLIAGSLGLFGIIVTATIQLVRMPSPFIQTTQHTCGSWSEMLDNLEALAQTESAMAGWVDGFTEGQGTIESAVYGSTSQSNPNKSPQLPNSNSLAARFGPKGLGIAIHPTLLKQVNGLRRLAAKTRADKIRKGDLFKFNFQLDWLWDWDRAFAPGSLIQCQATVPQEAAREVFPELIKRCHQNGFPPTLVVLKKHKPGIGLLDYLMDGYSLAIDLHCKPGRMAELTKLYQILAEMCIAAGGKIYLAKDFLLTAEQFRASHTSEKVELFKKVRRQFAPNLLFDSLLARRLDL